MITYNSIVDIAYQIDRKNNKLDDNCIKNILEIKKKLNIPIQNNFNQNDIIVNNDKNDKNDNNKDINMFDGSIDKVIGDLKVNLNKLTSKNYDKLYEKISLIINNYNDSNFFKEVVNVIFNVISRNKINGIIFSKLFKDLSSNNNYFNTLLNTELNNFHKSFEDIKYVSPNENYDKFCVYIKENENKVSLSLFFLECYKNNMINIDEIEKIIKNCINLFTENIIYLNNSNICEELINNIHILLKGILSIDNEKEKEKNRSILNDVLFDLNIENIKNDKSFNNKIKFKIMDIQDLIKI